MFVETEKGLRQSYAVAGTPKLSGSRPEGRKAAKINGEKHIDYSNIESILLCTHNFANYFCNTKYNTSLYHTVSYFLTRIHSNSRVRSTSFNLPLNETASKLLLQIK